MLKKNKVVLSLIILVIVLGAAYLVYMGRGAFSPGNEAKSVFSIESQSSVRADSSQGRLMIQNREGITAVSKNGAQQYVIINQLSNPAMHNAGKYTLMYDREGVNLSVYTGNTKVFDFKSDQAIKLAKINESGYTALVTDDSGFKQRVQIINQSGEVVYKWQLGDSYVTDIDISKNCKNIVASTVSSEGEIASGSIFFIDIDKESIINETKRENSIFLNVSFFKNSSVIAVGESEMLAFDGSGKLKWSVGYDERILQGFLVSDNGNPVLALAGTRNNTIFEMYNNTGKKTGEYISEGEVKSFDCADGAIAVCEKRDILLLGYNGSVKARTAFPKDIRSVVLLGRSDAAVVSGSSIEIVKI